LGFKTNHVRAVVVVASTVAALALAGATGASAANPQVQHFTFGPFTNTDNDFCGTGETVTDTFTARLTVWLVPNQPVDTRNQSVADDVFTSPSTGVTVVKHSAYSFTDVLISGDPTGVNTHEWTFKGAAQVTRVAGSGVIARDAGYLVVDVTWSGPEFESELIDIQIVRDAGGHSHFASDFCALMVPALGLG
jgi:hypothetical protein